MCEQEGAEYLRGGGEVAAFDRAEGYAVERSGRAQTVPAAQPGGSEGLDQVLVRDVSTICIRVDRLSVSAMAAALLGPVVQLFAIELIP